MTPSKKNSLPIDPAWIALGLAALVLVGTMVWLIAVRTVPPVAVPVSPVAGAPAAVAAPDPQLLARLAAAEATLAQLGARPTPEGTSPQAVSALVEGRIAALGPAIEARFGAVEGRLGVIEARGAEAAQATAQRLGETQRAVAEARTALEGALRDGLAAAGARAEAQEQALRTQADRVQQIGEAARQQQAAVQAQQAFAEQIGGRVAAVEAATQQAQAAAEALQRAVAAADAALQAQAAQQRTAMEGALRALSDQFAQRLAALQQAQEQAARTANEALAQRVAPLEQSARQMVEAQRGVERRAALEAVRRELDAGRALGAVLPRLGSDAPAALGRYATAAPPTEAALRQSFEEAARNARGTATPEGALNRLSSVLTIRRGDEVLVGDSNEGTLERARRALEAGDLDGALAQLARLPDATKTAMRPWLNEAEGLAAARAALRQLAQG